MTYEIIAVDARWAVVENGKQIILCDTFNEADIFVGYFTGRLTPRGLKADANPVS
jgi:hypothetical protein